MFIPCSASGLAQPIMTSSILPSESPARLKVSFIVSAHRSSGRVSATQPCFALPTGALAPLTITASFTLLPPLLISYATVFLLAACVAFAVVFLVLQLNLEMLRVLNQASFVHQ